MLQVGAIDRRVKAVLSQVPLVDGWENFHRLIRPDFVPGMNSTFQAGTSLGSRAISQVNSSPTFPDRQARAEGKPAGTLPVVDEDPLKPSALPTSDSYTFFSEWEKKSSWKNEVTVKR